MPLMPGNHCQKIVRKVGKGIMADLTRNKKLLLHICCGPCAAFPVQYLRRNFSHYDIYGYFYNPNIHPYQEFLRRLETLKDFSQTAGLAMIINENYDLEYFLTEVCDKKENRCRVCYEIRLQSAATFAKKEEFDAFTTTLLVSPYQKHELIQEIAGKIAQAANIQFCYIDFRQGWQEGVKMSRQLKLYRQPYCGCIFSEMERYYKKTDASI
jgi:predicted adenine nucleotide alpha hydrolase (AANH) superfamily ATPase